MASIICQPIPRKRWPLNSPSKGWSATRSALCALWWNRGLPPPSPPPLPPPLPPPPSRAWCTLSQRNSQGTSCQVREEDAGSVSGWVGTQVHFERTAKERVARPGTRMRRVCMGTLVHDAQTVSQPRRRRSRLRCCCRHSGHFRS